MLSESDAATMPAVELHDADDGFLSFDLRDLLACLGQPAIDAVWRCREVECAFGRALPALEALGDSLYTLSQQGDANASDRRADGFNPARDYVPIAKR